MNIHRPEFYAIVSVKENTSVLEITKGFIIEWLIIPCAFALLFSTLFTLFIYCINYII